VRSLRSPNEKAPWKELSSLNGAIESEFIRPLHLGATLLPYTTLAPLHAVVTWQGSRLLEGSDAHIDLCPGLAEWWREAESIWERHKGRSDLSLLQRVDYRRGLTLQFPPAPYRVIYSASGQYMAAARLDDAHAVVDTKL
jgi:hypothetical protein